MILILKLAHGVQVVWRDKELGDEVIPSHSCQLLSEADYCCADIRLQPPFILRPEGGIAPFLSRPHLSILPHPFSPVVFLNQAFFSISFLYAYSLISSLSVSWPCSPLSLSPSLSLSLSV